MWTVKKFKTFEAQTAWILANSGRFAINALFVNNGYAVEYKPLRIIG